MNSLRKLLAVPALVSIVIVVAGCFSTPTFEWVVQVESAVDETPVAGVPVIVEVRNETYVSAPTDAEGVASLMIPEMVIDRFAKVTVEATSDYQPFTELMFLAAQTQTARITLQPIDAPAEESPATEDTTEDTMDDAPIADTPLVTETEVISPAEGEAEVDVPAEPGPLAAVPPANRVDYYSEKPPLNLNIGQEYRATIRTSKGDIVVSLDAAAAPEHVNNFIFLSQQGFYDGLTFHRVEPGFVIQGGDPLGTGSGGPGYTIPGEFNLMHGEGALAMARLSDRVNPNRESSGSQFYITLAPAPALDGQYSVFGQVEAGMDVVQAIAIGDEIERVIIQP